MTRSANLVRSALLQMARKRAGQRGNDGQQCLRRFGFEAFVQEERAKLDLVAGGVHKFEKGEWRFWKQSLSNEFKALPQEVRQNYGRDRVGAVPRQPESRGRAERYEKMPDRNLDECVTSVGLRMQSPRRPVALSL